MARLNPSSKTGPVRAEQPVRPRREGRQRSIPIVATFLFWLLLMLPAIAIVHLPAVIDRRLVGAAWVLISAITYWLYRSDKRKAQAGEWRTPESTLHLAELLGGWPGAFLAQRVHRHKIAKTSYQVVFWFIVLLHQFAALDFLQNWRFSRQLLSHLGSRI